MKSTGIVRRIDELGRIVLPKELRRVYDFDVGTKVEAFVDGGNVVFKRYAPQCVLCGGEADLSEFKGRTVCEGCKAEIGRS